MVNYFAELASTIARLPAIAAPLVDFVRDCEGTLWLAGNGGSASTAQHWACDLSKAAGRRVQALGSNPAVLTAWANDVSYDAALANELHALAMPGDRVIAISCSGVSPNVYQLLRRAWKMKLPRALVTSQHYTGGERDLVVRVPAEHYGIIEDCHLAIGHYLTEELRG